MNILMNELCVVLIVEDQRSNRLTSVHSMVYTD